MITDNFIRMCEQAEEIQDQWRQPFKSYIGDLYWQGEEYLMIPEACICVTEIMFQPKDEHIWLPTQEQLQEMLFLKSSIFDGYSNVISMVYQFHLWLNEKFYGYYMHKPYPKGNILNELWLSFVMKEKYNKIWTSEKWVRAK